MVLTYKNEQTRISSAPERAFCARTRPSDVGVRQMPRSVMTEGPVCKKGKFAKRIARFANWDFDVTA
jgi:hypothetical protein